jgi:lipoprotein-anchoring transpeptidase ErfK/SrfK
LEGLEKNVNKGGTIDSYSRSIYIHGTPEEGLIGQPASHGCIRMKNKDVIELFDKVKAGTYVIILNN